MEMVRECTKVGLRDLYFVYFSALDYKYCEFQAALLLQVVPIRSNTPVVKLVFTEVFMIKLGPIASGGDPMLEWFLILSHELYLFGDLYVHG